VCFEGFFRGDIAPPSLSAAWLRTAHRPSHEIGPGYV
jgi:hypothetical protein